MSHIFPRHTFPETNIQIWIPYLIQIRISSPAQYLTQIKISSPVLTVYLHRKQGKCSNYPAKQIILVNYLYLSLIIYLYFCLCLWSPICICRFLWSPAHILNIFALQGVFNEQLVELLDLVPRRKGPARSYIFKLTIQQFNNSAKVLPGVLRQSEIKFRSDS